MKKSLNQLLFFVIVGLAGIAAVVLFNTTKLEGLGSSMNTDFVSVLSGISATTTSNPIRIEGAERVTLFFEVSNVYGTGYATSTFTFQVSPDGVNYVTFNKMIDNLTNSNSQNLTRVANQVIDTNSTDFLSMDLSNDTFKYLKVTDTITGTTTASVNVKALID